MYILINSPSLLLCILIIILIVSCHVSHCTLQRTNLQIYLPTTFVLYYISTHIFLFLISIPQHISLVFIYLLLSLSLLPTYLIVIATYNFNGAVVRHLSITHRNQLLIISISRRSARVKQ